MQRNERKIGTKDIDENLLGKKGFKSLRIEIECIEKWLLEVHRVKCSRYEAKRNKITSRKRNEKKEQVNNKETNEKRRRSNKRENGIGLLKKR